MENMIIAISKEFLKAVKQVTESKDKMFKKSAMLNLAQNYIKILEKEIQDEQNKINRENLSKRRYEVACETFETAEIPPVEAHDDWETSGNHWHKTVYWKVEHDHNCHCGHCMTSLRGGFDIEFKEGSTEIISIEYDHPK